jgi:subtilisin family serine protease
MTNPVVGLMPETTGRYIVTFKEGTKAEALNSLKKDGGVAKANIMMSSDFHAEGIDVAQMPNNGGVYFENLNIAVMNIDPVASGAMAADAGSDSAILAVEPEGIMYALGAAGGVSGDYLRGFRDAANAISRGGDMDDGAAGFPQGASAAARFADTAALTWGLQATKSGSSRFSGKGRRVAVLDTGLDLKHPDFVGRTITGKSFIEGVDTVQDGHGHGTHCVGTACGPKAPTSGRRYGIAWGAQIFVGKVLSDMGSGGDISILAGIEWAVANKCDVISMSLGSNVPTTSVAYETAGQRALNAGSLIVVAAGNNADRAAGVFAFVTRPANSRSMMAVAALDNSLKLANFSDRDTALSAGTAVDIGGPGVDIYSSWPMPQRNNIISGTSMATPHVAGIAALWAEATGATGASLWQRLIVNARALPLPVVDCGRGLVQAP